MQDPIADMLNRLVNAQAVKKETVEVPFSQIKYAIAKILESKGFVKSVEFKGKRTKKLIEIALLYPEGFPRIEGVKRISKPGQRVYAPTQKIRRIRSGKGIAIISTSKGLMTNQEAQKQKVGGEILCEIY
ncbi:MAG: 30S ribosomal protein S8 [Candidatus Wildermuthbacteria bacterium]|nr:30S ribosomal protein S8 [Candidatus Wildermuthbacteria bacterium]